MHPAAKFLPQLGNLVVFVLDAIFHTDDGEGWFGDDLRLHSIILLEKEIR
jgi:hypothetical protein